MYGLLKKILACSSFVLITLVGLLFVYHYKSELLGGYSQKVDVVSSTSSIATDLQKIAEDTGTVLARRIVDVKENERGEVENTYIPIGGELPKDLPLQENQGLIQNASYNTLYIIVKGNLSVQDLAGRLIEKGHQANAVEANSGLTLLKFLLVYPQAIMIAFVFLISFLTLLVADYIVNIRSVSIKRISGLGKYQIALRGIWKESLFLVGSASIVFVLAILILILQRNATLLAIELIGFPLLTWLVILLFLNFFASNLFYHILQRQPMNLSLKGKAPLHLIFVLVIVTQIFSLLTVMYSIYGVVDMTRQVRTLEEGKQAWTQYPSYFATHGLDTGEEKVDKERVQAFYGDLVSKTEPLYIGTTLDYIAMSSNSQKNSDYPTSENISNQLKVNRKFIKQSGLQLNTEGQAFFEQMGDFDRLILIPKSKENKIEDLKKVWSRFVQKGFAPDNAPIRKNHPDERVEVATYEGGENLFIYPIFTSVHYLVNRDSFVHDPIIIVYGSAYERQEVAGFDISNYVFDHPEQVREIIKQYKMTAHIGSFTNGLYSFESKIQQVTVERLLLLIASCISLATSILLMILLNTLYFYQGRKTYFIERLAGKSLIVIHHFYLLTLMCGYFLLAGLATFLHLPILVTLFPIFMTVGFLALFFFQLRQHQTSSILYLKGG